MRARVGADLDGAGVEVRGGRRVGNHHLRELGRHLQVERVRGVVALVQDERKVDGWIDPVNPPARAAGEAKLATPEYKVEIIVVAAVSKKA